MELRVLGPVELHVGDHWVDLGRRQRLALMVVLALAGGTPVPRETLRERISDDGDSKTAGTFNSYVSRVRNRLQSAGIRRNVLTERSGTYTLAIDPDNVDWLRFTRLHGEALRIESSGDTDTALAKLDEARELWRGEPLTGMSGAWARGMRERMRRVHSSVLADWGRIALRNRPPGELIGPLGEDAHHYPLNGPLTRNLMLALHEAGRTQEALTEYTRLRERLAEENGTYPDPPLPETFQYLLTANADGHEQAPPQRPSDDNPHTSREQAHAHGGRPLRDTLQRDVPDFTGRETAIAALLDSVRADTADVHIITGMPGVGKSTLATHAAHLLRDDFPDARLHVDLHGNREQPPKDPMEALRELLVMLGVSGQELHPTPELRAAQWRDATAGMRVLVVLDDARDHEQVRQLLPGSPGSTVLVTSRHRMPDLDGAHDHRLEPPPPREATRLFATLARQDPHSEDTRISDLVGHAEHLPLALRLLANRLRRHPEWRLADLITQLEQARDRIAEFHAGTASLQAAFRVSLDPLSPAARTAFTRLGLHPVPEFGAHAAAAVIGETVRRSHAVLDELVDASLLTEPVRHRYRMHALLAEFARGCAAEELSPVDRFGARHRALEYYLALSTALDGAHLPYRHRLDVSHTYPVELPDVGSRRSAVRLFEAELPTLLAVLRDAAGEDGCEHHAAGMAHALAELLDTYTPSGTAVDFHQRAVGIVADAGDHERLGQSLLDLGKAQLRASDPNVALDSVGRALHHWREAGDRVGQARALDLSGLIHTIGGQHERARGDLYEALELAREGGHRPTVASALDHLGICEGYFNERQTAIGHLEDARVMNRELGETRSHGIATMNLSREYQLMGRHPEASALADEAEELLREVGDKRSLARLTSNKAELMAAAFQHEQALQLQFTTLETMRYLHDGPGTVQALSNIGRAYLALDQPTRALHHLRESWELAMRTPDQADMAEILIGLGTAHRHLKDAGHAMECYSQALETARRENKPNQEAWALEGFGYLARIEGDPQRARARFLEGQEILRRSDHPDAPLFGIVADVVIDEEMRDILSR